MSTENSQDLCFVANGIPVEIRELDIHGRDGQFYDPACAIMQEAFDLSPDEIEISIDNTRRQVFGRVEQNELVSVALVSLVGENAIISYLATADHLRGQSRGSSLLKGFETICRQRQIETVSLYCKDENRYDFYARHGYTQVGDSFRKSL
ncbi:MAG: Acetyltransferase domain [Patescibacteria group bacterium]|nr:GNAT family N-acetyltransferase [Candidatus Saccharibacteria bacterium]MDQ5963097.1 Acetyltransferase domain [Patescibacteria group bacterium]